MLSDVLVRFIVLLYMTDHKKPRKKATEVAFLLFWVTRHSCLGNHAARAKTSSLAAVAVTILLDLRSSPTVLSICILLTQSKPGLAHQK